MEVEDTLYDDEFQENVEGKKRVTPPTSQGWDKVESLVKFLVIFYGSILVVTLQVLISFTMKLLLLKGILILCFLLG